MATQNSSNNQFTNNADGFDLAGGTTKRKITVTGGDVTVTGAGSNTVTLPASTTTLVGRDTTDTLTNKTMDGLTGIGTINLSNAESVVLPDTSLVAKNRCELYRTTDFTVGSGWVSLPMQAVDFDGNGMYNSATPERVTIQESGWYGFGMTARFAPIVAGQGIKIYRYNSSGTNIRGGVMCFFTNSSANILNISKEFYLNSGDYLVFAVFGSGSKVTASDTGEVEPNASGWVAMRSK
ncbi:MAG TPA: hypothetical protein VFL85_01500 [Candidatus Saccharimonadales bacterium]|nr:hypothetical protein [Candidatus Saccharimonadales bacterium]